MLVACSQFSQSMGLLGYSGDSFDADYDIDFNPDIFNSASVVNHTRSVCTDSMCVCGNGNK